MEASAENLSLKSMVHDYLKAWSQSDAFRRVFGAIISQLIEEGRVLNFSSALSGLTVSSQEES